MALQAAAVYDWKPVGNPEFSQSHTECAIAKSNEELAAIAGVHKNTITQAKAVQTKAAPEVANGCHGGCQHAASKGLARCQHSAGTVTATLHNRYQTHGEPYGISWV